MKNIRLRVIWIFPNVLLYLLLIGLSIFTVSNAEGLQEINRLIVFIVLILLLGILAIGGSFRIWYWMKEGKL